MSLITLKDTTCEFLQGPQKIDNFLISFAIMEGLNTFFSSRKCTNEQLIFLLITFKFL